MRDLGERFWSKVGPAGIDECWPWLASLNDQGYGQYNIGGTKVVNRKAHRLAYEELVGDVPEGLVLDHLCRNRACVNPWHLEPVTHKVNINRGVASERLREIAAQRTACDAGHEYTPDTARIDSKGARCCRLCASDMALRSYYKNREERLQRDPSTYTHGMNGYNTFGCRCDVCRAAKAEWARNKTAKRKAPTP